MPPGAGKHHGFPPVFSSPAAPGWDESPWASTPGFAPRSYPRRTPRRRQAIAHWPGYYTLDIDISRTSSGASHLNSCTLTSHIVGGGLHHDPLDPPAGQLVGQLQDLVGVEATCQTLVTRLPALVACGTRVQTMPDALATSIAATRPTISSCSSTSTCWPAGTDRPPPITGRRRAARGLGWDTETLTGVLVATVRDPTVGPRRQTQARPPTAKDTSASAGNPTHFQPCTASHKGTLRLRR